MKGLVRFLQVFISVLLLVPIIHADDEVVLSEGNEAEGIDYTLVLEKDPKKFQIWARVEDKDSGGKDLMLATIEFKEKNSMTTAQRKIQRNDNSYNEGRMIIGSGKKIGFAVCAVTAGGEATIIICYVTINKKITDEYVFMLSGVAEAAGKKLDEEFYDGDYNEGLGEYNMHNLTSWTINQAC
ncbi:MAG: hypothetical protein RAP03_02100, partial [Candidatus Electryonea clarkiae]|nr:hypothetical protein [Candidatus Electryonea clarkiae]